MVAIYDSTWIDSGTRHGFPRNSCSHPLTIAQCSRPISNKFALLLDKLTIIASNWRFGNCSLQVSSHKYMQPIAGLPQFNYRHARNHGFSSALPAAHSIALALPVPRSLGVNAIGVSTHVSSKFFNRAQVTKIDAQKDSRGTSSEASLGCMMVP